MVDTLTKYCDYFTNVNPLFAIHLLVKPVFVPNILQSWITLNLPPPHRGTIPRCGTKSICRRPLNSKHQGFTLQNTNFVCSNIRLNLVCLLTKRIYINDLHTLLQLLIKSKAYYLETQARLLRNLEGFKTSLLLCREKN